MPDNQVDGIKKLSKEEIKRSRNIVLDTIGETPKKQTDKNEEYLINNKNISRKVDGLNQPTKPEAKQKVSKESKAELISFVKEKKEKKIQDEKTVSTEKNEKVAENIHEEKGPSILDKIKLSLRKRAASRFQANKEKALAKARAKAEKEERIKQKALARQKEKELKDKQKQEEIKAEEERKTKIIEAKEQEKKKAEAKKQEEEKIKQVAKKPQDEKTSKKEEEPKEIKEIISIAGYEMMEKQGVDFVADLKAESPKEVKDKAKAQKKPSKKELEKIKLEAKKRAEEEKLIKLKEKNKKREEKEKQKQLRKERVREFIKSLNHRVASISKRSMHITTIIFVTGMVIYFLFLICIVKFDIDNSITRKVASEIPVPAYISNDGIVEYFKYKEIKSSVLQGRELDESTEEEIKMMIVRRLVIDKLIKKYNLLVNTNEGIVPQIRTQLAFDMEVNLVPINRIKKIKQLIEKEGDFVRVATKYGDELGQITLGFNDDDQPYYFNDVKDLELGEVSDTVFTPDGYYIFKCFDKDSTSIALSYVFISSNTLDDYINDAVRGYRLISFVD